MANPHGSRVRKSAAGGAATVAPVPATRPSGRTDAAASERQRLRDARQPTAGDVLSDVRWLPVESSSIDAIGYKNGTMYVRFKENNAEYQYDNVPWNVYCRLHGAARARDGSVGRVFNLQVRPTYQGKKLR